MTDETTPDLRLLAERIDRNHAEDRADIARLEQAITAIPAQLDRYVPQRVYDADELRRAAERAADHERFQRLEETERTRVAGSRAWVVGVSLAVVGAVFGVIAQMLLTRGGH